MPLTIQDGLLFPEELLSPRPLHPLRDGPHFAEDEEGKDDRGDHHYGERHRVEDEERPASDPLPGSEIRVFWMKRLCERRTSSQPATVGGSEVGTLAVSGEPHLGDMMLGSDCREESIPNRLGNLKRLRSNDPHRPHPVADEEVKASHAAHPERRQEPVPLAPDAHRVKRDILRDFDQSPAEEDEPADIRSHAAPHSRSRTKATESSAPILLKYVDVTAAEAWPSALCTTSKSAPS